MKANFTAYDDQIAKLTPYLESDQSDVVRKKIEELSVANIKNISATFITLVFDDPLIGFHPINIRIAEVLECKAYK